MTAIYITETVIILAGAAYFFAAPARFLPWIGGIVFTAAIVAMLVTKLLA